MCRPPLFSPQAKDFWYGAKNKFTLFWGEVLYRHQVYGCAWIWCQLFNFSSGAKRIKFEWGSLVRTHLFYSLSRAKCATCLRRGPFGPVSLHSLLARSHCFRLCQRQHLSGAFPAFNSVPDRCEFTAGCNQICLQETHGLALMRTRKSVPVRFNYSFKRQV